MRLVLRTDRLTLWNGSSADVATVVAPESIDSIVTDPPAGISFMGKAWDGDKGGRDAWVAWLAEILRAAMTCLKPGGHALVWALPRTSHWTATAVEDAGFEIRDVVMHLFGCLTPDAEILTEHGWERYQTLDVGRLAMCYDVDDESFSWGPIQEVPVFPFDGSMVRVLGDRTDHVITPGHRCVVERGRGFEFATAEEVARERDARIPVLEDVRALLRAVPLPHAGASGPQPLLLEGVLSDGEAAPDTARGLSSVRDRVPAEVDLNGEGEALQLPMLGGCTDGSPRRGGAHEVDRLARQGGMDGGGARVLSGEDVGRAQSGVEGRCDDLPQARELCGDPLRPMPVGVPADGAQGRLRDGASVDRLSPDGADAPAVGGGASRRPRSDEQPPAQPDALRVESGPQAVRVARFTAADLVRCERVPYVGPVWCVRVPTRAFVARQNGMVFVTGNTGFPKSLDVSKAIDDAAGAVRPVSGRGVAECGYLDRGEPCRGHNNGTLSPTVHALATSPATPEAARFAGVGTALKPAAEHWILARKPLLGTVAANALRFGTGGLRIDDCRIAATGKTPAPVGQYTVGTVGHNGMRDGSADHLGRWPAHVTLDEEAARALDEMSGALATHGGTVTEDMAALGYGSSSTGSTREIVASTGGASRFFYVAKATRAEKDAGLDHLPLRTGGEATDREEGSAGLDNPRSGAQWRSGVRNHHPTVKSIELMRWLCRLVTPRGGTVLDLFAGSGTTGLAALAEGLRFVGVELEAEFCDVAAGRLAHAACLPTPERIAKGEDEKPVEPKRQPSLFDALTGGAA